ncbi:MAG TPA: lipopolysaccharide kinase InaA family protein [Candidatus Binatia bacterium]|nr:lipopolysaccharide kinase InaA family protein [Candidatus Binatia bacterium]
MLPDFVLIRHRATSGWVDANFNKPAVKRLIWDPDRFFSDERCVVVKDQKKIKVARVAVEVSGELYRIFIKRYNAFSWRARLLSIFTPSGAFRSLQGAAILQNTGFATAKPLAALESRRCGVVTKSFYLSEEIADGKTADTYWREDLSIAQPQRLRRRRQFISGLALTFQALHRQGVYHNDLKDANIIVVPGKDAELFYLLDLEGMRRYSDLNLRRKVKNIVQLNHTLGRLLRRTEKMYFLKVYLDSSFASKRIRRRWVTAVLEQSRRRDLKSRRARKAL